ncbi:MAG: NYN domain-containing protein [Victivallales bacterium]|nr:NYN domain-containing protein [Victivallales bacterium]
MSLFSTNNLSEEACNWLVEHCSQKDLLPILKKYPQISRSVFGGFRPTAENLRLPAVHLRLMQELTGNVLVCEKLVDVFGRYARDCHLDRMLGWLGPRWFLSYWRDMGRRLSYFREYFVLLCATYPEDDAESELYRRFGRRLLKTHGMWKMGVPQNDDAPEIRDAQSFIRTACHFFYPDKMFLEGAAEIEQEEAIKKELASLRQRLEKEQALTRSLKAKLSEAEQKTDECQKEKNTLKKELGAFRHEQDARLQRMQDDYSQKLCVQYELMQRDFLDLDGKWLQTSSNETDEADVLLERSENLLAQQRQLNIKYGTRSGLREKENQLRMAYMQLATAAKESLHPHDELRTLMDAINRKRQKINALLEDGNEHVGSELYEYLFTTIRSLKHSNEIPLELERIGQFIRDAESMELLQTDERTNLLNQCDKRRMLWQNMSRTGEDRSQRNDSEYTPEIMDIRRHLSEAANVILLVDGYNVMMRSDGWKRYQEKRGMSFQEVRGEFIARCRSIARYFKSLRLVFDGDDAYFDNVLPCSDGLYVVYAQHKDEEHNADRYIKEFINGDKQAGERFWLCSEDFGIRQDVQRVDAFVSNLALNRFIGM